MSMGKYESEMARLSAEIEFWRDELRRCLNENLPADDAHEKLAALYGDRQQLALSENWDDWDAANTDIDAAQAVAQESFRARVEG